jgi:hypothetical protein
VGAMGAALLVESAEGQGSHFWFDLPQDLAGVPTLGPMDLAEPGSLRPGAGEHPLAPSVEEIRLLLELASRGDASALQGRLAGLAAADPAYLPFVTQLEQPLSLFKMKTVRDLLHSHLNQESA